MSLTTRYCELLRKPENPDVPIGPKWLLEVARDITALGSGADLSDPF
jgi:hypothetical protein